MQDVSSSSLIIVCSRPIGLFAHEVIVGGAQVRMHSNKNLKLNRQKACGKKRVEQKKCFSAKMLDKICSENLELALAT